jgi:uncharacterized membrane protein HdeD (DUF308 family)
MQEPLLVGTAADEPDEGGDPLWWVPLVTGSLWVLFALIVFRFDYTSVSAISILLGTVLLAAALVEAIQAAGSHGWWRVTHIGLTIAFAVIGVLAFVHPQNTFRALAAIFAFFLFLRGIVDVIAALYARPAELWWVGLVSGVVLILLAFWAAGDFGNKAFLLVVWIGAAALAQGVLQIVTAFRLRQEPAPTSIG